jgi:hypothetical protein
MVFDRKKISSWVPTRPKTMNDCTGEAQQQITAMPPILEHTCINNLGRQENMDMSPDGAQNEE